MKTFGTYFVNDPERPLRYGEVGLINPLRQRLRGEPLKEGVVAYPVFCGFCGTDLELMRMGQRGELGPKFPPGQERLINGHEGVVWVPSENRFAIVLIRGGDSYDPTRFTEDETYFEKWQGKTLKSSILAICLFVTHRKEKKHERNDHSVRRRELPSRLRR